jgi:RNA recognition motif-containing protein
MADAKLFVGNLNWSVDSGQLREMFFECGTVQSADLIEGKGFVEMSVSRKRKRQERP